MKKCVLFIMALLLVVGAYGTASADVSNGKRIFLKYCAKCHAKDGTVSEYGRKKRPRPARNLRTNRLFIAPAELLTIIKYGLYGREMKGWQSVLTNDEIIDVAEFVRTLKYEPDIKAGKKFFMARCARCHLEKGPGKKLFKAPDLDMSPLGAIEMARVVRFGRHGTMMSPKRDMFKNPDIANVVGYLQSIKK
ncbi:MAG: c-type cytochrome [Thermodesulfobacteriota bacterium]